jgi:hypothetical protein
MIYEPLADHALDSNTHGGPTRDQGFYHYADSSQHCCLSAIHEGDSDTKFADSSEHNDESVIHDTFSGESSAPSSMGGYTPHAECHGTPNTGYIYLASGYSSTPGGLHTTIERDNTAFPRIFYLDGEVWTHDTPRERDLFADFIGYVDPGSGVDKYDMLLTVNLAPYAVDSPVNHNAGPHLGCGVHSYHYTYPMIGMSKQTPGLAFLRWKLDPSPETEGDGVAANYVVTALHAWPVHEFEYKNFIPCEVIPAHPPFTDPYFAGDNREFGYLLGDDFSGGAETLGSRSYVSVSVTGSPDYWQLNGVYRPMYRLFGTTKSYDSDAAHDTGAGGLCTYALNANAAVLHQATLNPNNNNLKMTVHGSGPTDYWVEVLCKGKNPVEPLAPAIDASIDIHVTDTALNTYNNPGTSIVSCTGEIDQFPAHELYVDGEELATFDPRDAGTNPNYLIGPPLYPKAQFTGQFTIFWMNW